MATCGDRFYFRMYHYPCKMTEEIHPHRSSLDPQLHVSFWTNLSRDQLNLPARCFDLIFRDLVWEILYLSWVEKSLGSRSSLLINLNSFEVVMVTHSSTVTGKNEALTTPPPPLLPVHFICSPSSRSFFVAHFNCFPEAVEFILPFRDTRTERKRRTQWVCLIMDDCHSQY